MNQARNLVHPAAGRFTGVVIIYSSVKRAGLLFKWETQTLCYLWHFVFKIAANAIRARAKQLELSKCMYSLEYSNCSKMRLSSRVGEHTDGDIIFFQISGKWTRPPVYTQYAINYRRSFAIVKNLLVSFLTVPQYLSGRVCVQFIRLQPQQAEKSSPKYNDDITLPILQNTLSGPSLIGQHRPHYHEILQRPSGKKQQHVFHTPAYKVRVAAHSLTYQVKIVHSINVHTYFTNSILLYEYVHLQQKLVYISNAEFAQTKQVQLPLKKNCSAIKKSILILY